MPSDPRTLDDELVRRLVSLGERVDGIRVYL